MRALAGDSTITSRVPCPFAAAESPVLVPLSDAAVALLAALLLAGTLFPTSHPRHCPVPSRRVLAARQRDARRKYHTRRDRKMPSMPYLCNPQCHPDCSRPQLPTLVMRRRTKVARHGLRTPSASAQ